MRAFGALLALVALFFFGEVASAQTYTTSGYATTGGATASTTTSGATTTAGATTTGTTTTAPVTVRTVPSSNTVVARAANGQLTARQTELLARAALGDLTATEIQTNAPLLADALGVSARDVQTMTAADLQRMAQAKGMNATNLANVVAAGQAAIANTVSEQPLQTNPSEILPPGTQYVERREVLTSQPARPNEAVLGEQARQAPADQGTLLRSPRDAGTDWGVVLAALGVALLGIVGIVFLAMSLRGPQRVVVRAAAAPFYTPPRAPAPPPRPRVVYNPEGGRHWSVAYRRRRA